MTDNKRQRRASEEHENKMYGKLDNLYDHIDECTKATQHCTQVLLAPVNKSIEHINQNQENAAEFIVDTFNKVENIDDKTSAILNGQQEIKDIINAQSVASIGQLTDETLASGFNGEPVDITFPRSFYIDMMRNGDVLTSSVAKMELAMLGRYSGYTISCSYDNIKGTINTKIYPNKIPM